MVRSTRRQLLLTGLALLPLAGVLQRPAAALVLLKPVTPAQAKELGITVHVQPRPDSGDVWVKVDFKTTGALQKFTGASLLVMKDGKRLVSAQLAAHKQAVDSAPEEKQVDFYLDPAVVPDAVVTVVAYDEPLTGMGYQLRLKEFLPR